MITKKPIDVSKYQMQTVLTKTARIAFKYILKALDKDTCILLPSYIGITDKEGSGVFDPILEVGMNYDFYRLDNELSIDYNYLKSKLNKNKVIALLVIHYFGFAQNDMEFLSDYCRTNKIILIEDCAHSFHSSFNGKLLGSYGDFSFFSVHKFLSTTDGGFLRINNQKFSIDEIPEEDKIQKNTLEILFNSDIDKISEVRCQNYKYFLQKIERFNWINVLYKRLPAGIVPMNLPVLIKEKREFVYNELMKREMPTVSLYYRLIKEISKEEFPEMYMISRNILNFPVHQEIMFEDINGLCNALIDIEKNNKQ